MAAALVAFAGNWEMVFWIAAGMDLLAAFMAILVLKPMRAGPHRRLRRAAHRPRLKPRSKTIALRISPAWAIARAGEFVLCPAKRAGLAQLVEHVICNQPRSVKRLISGAIRVTLD